jgi:replicative DNA helicase
LITFVGEAKKGKSLMTLIMAQAAHSHGIVPLYISFEMSIEEQEARYDAIVAGVSHTKIIRGDLNMGEIQRIEDSIKIRRNMQEFIMTEDASSLTTVSAIAGKLQQYRPGLVIVDGVYLMDDEHGEPKGSPQALTNITRGLKRLAQRFDVPIIGTTQVLAWKLGNKKSRAITSDAIGYSSSFVQDSDLVLGVESDPDIDNQSIIRVILARAAPKGEVRIKWDWENMDFTEVGEDGGIDNDWYY